jgi:hypothetical protein
MTIESGHRTGKPPRPANIADWQGVAQAELDRRLQMQAEQTEREAQDRRQKAAELTGLAARNQGRPAPAGPQVAGVGDQRSKLATPRSTRDARPGSRTVRG